MVIKEDKQRLHRLLADAIPLLCKSGLPLKGTFCIEALIGITLEDDEVMLVSFKQEIRADENLPRDEYSDSTTACEEEMTTANEAKKTAYLSATGGKTIQNERYTGEELLEGRNGRVASRTFQHDNKGGKRTLPKKNVLPVVKVEEVDLKMEEEDVDVVSNRCHLRFNQQDAFVTDSLSWNFHAYNSLPAPVSRIAEAVLDDEECANPESQASWAKGDRRTGNKSGRKRTGQIGGNGCLSHDEHSYKTPPDAGSNEWHRKRRDGRSATSSSLAAFSYMGNNPKNNSKVCDLPVEIQDSYEAPTITDIQLTDDRISLEQTCRILSSYRFANSDNNLYSCHICEAKLRGRQTLNEHIRGTHLCAHIYRCPNCGMSFKWRSGLQRHRSRCTAVATSAAETQAPAANT